MLISSSGQSTIPRRKTPSIVMMNLGSSILLICYHFIEMLLAPSYQSRKCWHQRFACLCQGILHSGWNLRIDLTMNKVALLQILQCLREHLLRTIRHQTTDLVKAQYTSLAGVKHVEHQHGPLVAETTHYLPDRTG